MSAYLRGEAAASCSRWHDLAYNLLGDAGFIAPVQSSAEREGEGLCVPREHPQLSVTEQPQALLTAQLQQADVVAQIAVRDPPGMSATAVRVGEMDVLKSMFFGAQTWGHVIGARGVRAGRE
ncbi:hypothetical protein [Nannocystis pusilla]|uniref:hypothetical protein n=1 Tax=Nannocystis pusilla TaxID=889268 RepID=UPI003B7A1AF1